MVSADEISHEVVICWNSVHKWLKLEGCYLVKELSQTLLHKRILGFLVVGGLIESRIVTMQRFSQVCLPVAPNSHRDDESEELL
jgi:hypothetical protein